MFRVAYGQARWWAACLMIGAAGCVDVPEPTAIVDRGPPTSDQRVDPADGPRDAGPDSTPLDSALDAVAPPPDGALDTAPSGDTAPPLDTAPPRDAAPDGEADMGAPAPVDACLVPLTDPPPPDGFCLRVRSAGDPDQRFAFAASVAFELPAGGQRVAVIGGLDVSQRPAQGMATLRIYDPETHRWVADGPSLPGGRWGHAAVRTDDGSLVVAGGSAQRADDGYWEGTATAHRWMPGPAGWARVEGSLQPGRSDGAMTYVPGVGAVYVGGTADREALPTTAFDVIVDFAPITMDADGLRAARTGPAAVTLPDDSVLIVGGLGTDRGSVVAAERYGEGDIALLPLPDPPQPRGFGGAAPLPEGALFVGGIERAGDPPTDAAFRYQSRYNRFVPLPPLSEPRMRPTVSAIGPAGQGWRLVVGGESGGGDAPAPGEPGIVELYDPHGDRFMAFQLPAPVRQRRALHTAASFETPDGHGVLVAGGYDPALDPTDPAAYMGQALRFDLELPPDAPRRLGGCLFPAGEQPDAPCLRLWRGPPLSAPRNEVGAVAIPEGRIIVTGGLDTATGTLSDVVESWLPGTTAWDAAPGLPSARAGHTLLRLSNDLDPPLLVLGGYATWVRGDYEAQDAVEYYDPGEGTWSESAHAFAEPRANAAVVVVGQDIIAIGGQTGAPGALLASVEQFTLGGVLALPSLNVARTRHVSCVINDDGGRWVMTYGGFVPGATTGAIETFTPGDPAWVEMAPGTALGDSTCIGGRDGVDIFGGKAEPAGGSSDLWQRFDAARQGIAEVGRMAVPRSRPTVNAIGLLGSEAPAHLIVGGEDGGDRALVELVFRDSGTRYAYVLPDGIRPRRGHRGVSHSWLAGIVETGPQQTNRVSWRDVVIVGGNDAQTGAPLDEVLVFGLDVRLPAPAGEGPPPDEPMQ